jgi:hypothetical protein
MYNLGQMKIWGVAMVDLNGIDVVQKGELNSMMDLYAES